MHDACVGNPVVSPMDIFCLQIQQLYKHMRCRFTKWYYAAVVTISKIVVGPAVVFQMAHFLHTL